MKKIWIATCTLLFAATVGFAQAPSKTSLTGEVLAAIWAQPAALGSCGTLQSGMSFTAKGPTSGLEKALCTATANCGSGTVSCQGNNSTTSCAAVDRNCAIGELGSVTCDGRITYCPTGCCSGTPQQINCCYCNLTGSCASCCACENGPFSYGYCLELCNP